MGDASPEEKMLVICHMLWEKRLLQYGETKIYYTSGT
jgi:hypothetical protein